MGAEREEIRVAGYNQVRPDGGGKSENGVVIRIAADGAWQTWRIDNLGHLAQIRQQP